MCSGSGVRGSWTSEKALQAGTTTRRMSWDIAWSGATMYERTEAVIFERYAHDQRIWINKRRIVNSDLQGSVAKR